MRINSTLPELVSAMVIYRKDFEMRIYPNAGHAFVNEQSPPTYEATAATGAWE